MEEEIMWEANMLEVCWEIRWLLLKYVPRYLNETAGVLDKKVAVTMNVISAIYIAITTATCESL